MKRKICRITLMIGMLCVAFFSIYLECRHGLLDNDTLFHYDRVMDIHHILVTHQLPLVRECYGVMQGNAIPALYPWLLLLPAVCLSFFLHGIPLIITAGTLTIIFQYLISYFSAKTIFHSINRALLFSVTYVGIMIPTISIQGDYGMFLASSFIPLVLFGLIHFIKSNRYWMLIVGLALITYTHVITAVIILAFLVIVGLLNWRICLQKSRGLIIIILAYLYTTALVTIPALRILLTNSITIPQESQNFCHLPWTFFPLLILIILPIIFILYQSTKFNQLDKQLFVITIALVLVNISFIGNTLVKIFPFIRAIQFSYRFIPIATACATYLLVKYLFKMKSHSFIKLAKIVVVFALCFPVLTILGKDLSRSRSDNYRSITYFDGYLLPHAQHRAMYQFCYLSDNDYAPHRSVKSLKHVHNHVFASNRGTTTFVKHSQKNVVLPVTIYHSIKYKYLINSRPLSKKNLNYHLSNKYQLLTLRHLPRGKYTVQIKKAKFIKLRM